MGHYDEYYEEEAAIAFEKKKKNREENIPKILENLNDASRLLRVYANDISKSVKMEDDLSFIILALEGQIK